MIFRHLFLIPIGIALAAEVPAAEPYLAWRAESASVPEPLGGLKGDAQRGRAVAANQAQGNCLACHPLPIPEEPFHGEIGPPLAGVGSRLSVAGIRLWVINSSGQRQSDQPGRPSERMHGLAAGSEVRARLRGLP